MADVQQALAAGGEDGGLDALAHGLEGVADEKVHRRQGHRQAAAEHLNMKCRLDTTAGSLAGGVILADHGGKRCVCSCAMIKPQ